MPVKSRRKAANDMVGWHRPSVPFMCTLEAEMGYYCKYVCRLYSSTSHLVCVPLGTEFAKKWLFRNL